MSNERNQMTVGQLKELLKNISDDLLVYAYNEDTKEMDPTFYNDAKYPNHVTTWKEYSFETRENETLTGFVIGDDSQRR